MADRDSYRGSIDPREVMEFIRTNCTDITLEQVGERFSCHPNSITRILKQTYGLTFQAALAHARADLAKELLASGDTVDETAAKCGYASLSHFTRMFKEQCGMTPGRYRRQALFNKH